jgi:hypothetical protein
MMPGGSPASGDALGSRRSGHRSGCRLAFLVREENSEQPHGQDGLPDLAKILRTDLSRPRAWTVVGEVRFGIEIAGVKAPDMG